MKQETICIKEDCYFGYTEDRIRKFVIVEWVLEDQLEDFKKGLVCQTGHDLITINEDEDFVNWKWYPKTREEVIADIDRFGDEFDTEELREIYITKKINDYKIGDESVWIIKPTRKDLYYSYMARQATKKHIVTKKDRIDYSRYVKYDQLNNMDLSYWTARSSSLCPYNNKFVWDFDSTRKDPLYDEVDVEIERINKVICMNCLKKAS